MNDYLTLKPSNCKNCYKCIRSCPVKSISFSQNQAQIVPEACILCGHCFVVCPQNAKEIRNDIPDAEALIQNNAHVTVSLAPSFVAAFPGMTRTGMEKALQKLGFSDVRETAEGAQAVKECYDRLCREGENDVLISSCCHTINLLIEKYYPAALPCLARVITPMEASARQIKS